MFKSRPKILTKHTQELERQSIHPRTLIHPAIELVLTEKNLYVSHTRLFTLFLSFYISCVSKGRQATEKKKKKFDSRVHEHRQQKKSTEAAAKKNLF